jgi:hypothetical protein
MVASEHEILSRGVVCQTHELLNDDTRCEFYDTYQDFDKIFLICLWGETECTCYVRYYLTYCTSRWTMDDDDWCGKSGD